MPVDERYRQQVALLMQTLPAVAKRKSSLPRVAPPSIYLSAIGRACRSISTYIPAGHARDE
jgi:hypothetical protein